ncbi:nuclease-related domain-containing DEAD/DEAH box helicase [Roseomonas mucosa]|jgi:hypothetical protein|uniref:nuclease-related domain-containing DEAD/DEAH box helicase n=1 Tax=Roseomonas mucosa TaxID=207340 RepID=UPI001EF4F7D1|nr:NERD domain-containing protein/DEAD/DEAH box helicase [Roseomonas mucosa]MCG7354507.1 AAA family ATPase [Roseomonas mucosa]
MSYRVVSPPVEAFSELRTPLTSGELAVFEMFDRTLPMEWEIYVQPHMNGLRPDFVLLNPNVGIAVFEVKDWNLDAVRYSVRRDANEGLLLWGERNGQQFALRSRNPVNQVVRYKNAIYRLYCPRLKQNLGMSAITAGVIFTNATSSQVRSLLGPLMSQRGAGDARYHTLTGRDELERDDIQSILPSSRYHSSKHMTEVMAADLRGWLAEPDFSAERRRPLLMDRAQRNLVETWPESGFRRIKGPAGSGKSLVLAARAAKLANEGKSVLVVTFNITLMHYLRDMVIRGLERKGATRNVVYKHFHDWCKDVCTDADMEFQYKAVMRGFRFKGQQERSRILNEDMPMLAAAAIRENGHMLEHYDAVLVDEGQDFVPSWLNVVQGVLKAGGQMLLVADATQDVYGTARKWTDDDMKKAKFSGPWAQLRTGYRVPPAAQEHVARFARTFMAESDVDLPDPAQRVLNVERCHLRWIPCSPCDAAIVCEGAIIDMMEHTGRDGLANADITFLTDNPAQGAEVVDLLTRRHIETIIALDQVYEERRREKLAFFVGKGRVRATTLHSFKGWESRLLVIYLSMSGTPEQKAAIYAGLTRLKEHPEGSHLTVVCSDPALNEYGRTWPT